MRISFEGREYDWDGNVTVEEAMFLFDNAHLGLYQLNDALSIGNPYALTALVVMAKKRAGEAIRWQDMLSRDLTSMIRLPDKIAEPDDVQDEAPMSPDPTLLGPTPESDIPTTS